MAQLNIYQRMDKIRDSIQECKSEAEMRRQSAFKKNDSMRTYFELGMVQGFEMALMILDQNMKDHEFSEDMHLIIQSVINGGKNL